MKLTRRIAALLMAGAMVCSTLPVNAWAVEATNTGGLCEHHPEHTAECGYSEGTEGTPCNHEHNEDCYTLVTECVHEHTEDCYPAESVSENTATPSDAEDREPTACTHECSEESGCIKKVLDCRHKHKVNDGEAGREDGLGRDEDCGYTPAEPGTPCTFVCEICHPQDSGQPEDKPAEDECNCTEPCTEGSVNEDCPVCGAEDADLTACKGAALSTPSDALALTPEQVQALIDALPTLEDLQAMAQEEQDAVYEELQAAYEAYNALTDEQKAAITGSELLDRLFDYFNGMVNALATENGVEYLDENGKKQTANNVTVVDSSTTTWNSGWYVVKDQVNSDNRFVVSGTVHLILADGCTLTANDGIQVEEKNTLYIYAQSASGNVGKIIAYTNYSYGAGIGAHMEFYPAPTPACGTIIINGGDIDAYGDGGAGIGGSDNGVGGNITINGGHVKARGNNGAAGIGGGYSGTGGTITINGGVVTAIGGDKADWPAGAGIGGGGWDGGEQHGSFSTGNNGSAIIFATGGTGAGGVKPSIGDSSKQNSWKGVIFQGTSGKVYGNNITITDSFEIPAGYTLEIPDGVTLTLADGVTITNHGTISGGGTINGDGAIDGNQPSGVDVNLRSDAAVSVSFSGDSVTGNSAPYGSTISITASAIAVNRALFASAEKNNVDFYLGDPDNGGKKLGTANVSGSSATLSGVSIWSEKGWNIGNNTVYAVFGGSDELKGSTGTANLTVTKGTPDFGTLKVTNGQTETTTFTYGDTITISGKVTASSTEPQTNALAAPEKNQAALFLNTTQLTEPVTVEDDGSFTISYDTSKKGIQATGQEQTLTVKYGGSDNLNDGSAACTVTLNKKPVTAQVQGEITKVYDKKNNASVPLGFETGAILDGDEVNVSAPDAAYVSAEAGTEISISLGTLSVTGRDAQWYDVSAPTGVTGSITKSESLLNVKMDKGTYTYGDTVKIEVTPDIFAVNVLSTEPNKVELIYEDEVIIEATDEDGDGVYVLEYQTTEKALPIGTYTITISFGGDHNLRPMEWLGFLTLNPKPVDATIKGEITKPYDGDTDITFNLGVDGLEDGDSVTGTVAGTYDTPDAGDSKTVTISNTPTWTGDYEWYKITVPKTVTGSITQIEPEVIWPTASLTYGQKLSEAELTGGSGDGTFWFESGDTVPSWNDTTEYTMVFTPNDTVNYEVMKKGVAVTVLSKPLDITKLAAEPESGAEATKAVALTATLSGMVDSDIPAGKVKFTYTPANGGETKIITENAGVENNGGTLTASATWENVPAGTWDLAVEYIPAEGDHYEPGESGSLNGYDIAKTNQSGFQFTGEKPRTETYSPGGTFTVTAEGGQSAGAVSYSVTSGEDVISIEANTGKVAVLKAGSAVITATKAGDNNYNDTSATLNITIHPAALAVPEGLALASTDPGKATARWGAVEHASSYSVQLYKNGVAQGQPVPAEGTTCELAIPDAGSYTFTVQAIKPNDNYTNSEASGMSAALTFYEVAFDAAGGSEAAKQIVVDGGHAAEPAAPIRSGYTFNGWYNGGAKWNFENELVTRNITLTAQWTSHSGGSSSSSSDSTILDCPDEDDPQAPTTAETKTVKTDRKGSIVITKSMVADAISTAQADSRKNGNTANGVAVVVPVEIDKTQDGVPITLKADALDKLVSFGVKRFTIDADRMADFGFTLDTLKELDRQTSGDLILKVKTTAVSSQEAKAAIGSRPAYDITLWYVKGGKETQITSLNGKTVSVALPYTPAQNEQTGSLYAVSVDGNGKVQWLLRSSYNADQKTVIFEAEHFSIYGVGYKNPVLNFTDISGHWAKEHILFTVSRGLFSGTSETTFSPNTTLTRGMFVTALGRLAGINPADYQTGTFTDVKADAYYAPYVNWAASKGIVSGTTSTTFAPDSSITREQMAVILKNYADKMGYSIPKTLEAVTFADNAQISSWAKAAVQTMQMAGVLSGKTGNQFDPKGNATRAEAATILHRFVEVIIDPQTANGWTQNDSGEWSYYKDGEPVKGWLSDDQKWYWLDKTTGKMFSGGWKQIDGKWYCFDTDGSMAVSTKVDGYEVGADGARK